MSNQSKRGKHAAALPQQKAADVGESEAKAVAATNPEREEKFATKGDLKQLKNSLVAKIEHGFQLILQQLRFEVTNLNQKIDANDARHTERMDASDARHTERMDASDARTNEKFDELRSDMAQLRRDVDKQFEAKEKIDAERSAASDARNAERLDASEARSIERAKASEARIIERVNHIESMMKQVSEKNLYKIAFIVAAILAAMAAVYQFFKSLIS